MFFRAGVLTFTAGGTVPVFHRFAIQLSSGSSRNTLVTEYSIVFLYYHEDLNSATLNPDSVCCYTKRLLPA